MPPTEFEKTLAFIRAHAPELTETPGDSPWTRGRAVFRHADDAPGSYTHMVGTLKNGKITWHMMPLYAVAEMREKWLDALRPFIAGKSCIHFRAFDDLPQAALKDIVENGGELFRREMAAFHARRAKKRG